MTLATQLRSIHGYVEIAQRNITRDLGQPDPNLTDVLAQLTSMISDGEMKPTTSGTTKDLPDGGDGPGSVSCGDTPEEVKATHDAAEGIETEVRELADPANTRAPHAFAPYTDGPHSVCTACGRGADAHKADDA